MWAIFLFAHLVQYSKYSKYSKYRKYIIFAYFRFMTFIRVEVPGVGSIINPEMVPRRGVQVPALLRDYIPNWSST